MSELPRPRRALLASTPLERAKSFDREDELPYSFASQNQTHTYHALFSKFRLPFVVEIPILPIANPRNVRPSRPGLVLPPSDSRRNSQKVIQSRIISPRTSNPSQCSGSSGKGAENLDTCLDPEFTLKDSREVGHNGRKESLAKMLLPLLGDDAETFILLCWGREHECSITPVPISNPIDEAVIWRDIRQIWYSRRGWWRRYVPCFGVKRVDIVEVVP